jgi:predicted dinucleotide-binding enzyme
VLTIPWEGVEETAKQLVQIGIGNKILIDATNPIGPGITPALPNTTSGGMYYIRAIYMMVIR